MINPDELAALEEQRNFLLTSLDDLDREHDAGDLDDDDYATLRADYTARAAQVIHAIDDAQRLIDDAAPTHRGWRRIILVAAVVVVAIVAAGVVTSTSGHNDATANNQPKVTPQTQTCIDKMGALVRSMTGSKVNQNFGTDTIATIECFTKVIEDDPKDAVAYTYRGRTLAFLGQQLSGVASPTVVASFVQRATADLAKARKLAPEYPDALAFSAMNALSMGDTKQAKAYLAQLDALQLPANSSVLPIVNNVLRPAIDAASSTTTPRAATTTRVTTTSTP